MEQSIPLFFSRVNINPSPTANRNNYKFGLRSTNYLAKYTKNNKRTYHFSGLWKTNYFLIDSSFGYVRFVKKIYSVSSFYIVLYIVHV